MEGLGRGGWRGWGGEDGGGGEGRMEGWGGEDGGAGFGLGWSEIEG